jgi:hypothetical protein
VFSRFASALLELVLRLLSVRVAALVEVFSDDLSALDGEVHAHVTDAQSEHAFIALERLVESEEVFMYSCMTRLMLRRL